MKTKSLLTKGINRRDFLQSTAKATAALSLLSAAPYVARGRVLGANDTIGVGFIGVGGRGSSHIATVRRLIEGGEKAKVVAVCDAYRYRLNEAAKPTGAKAYMKHKELLADPNVDAVCIATPDRLHVPQALDAIHAGKDVYCEKPMGHWSQFDLSKRFYEETIKLKRVVQIGNQGNSSPAWQKVRELVQQGAIGRVQLVTLGFYRRGDLGERMPIPDPQAKPGPDLDWEAFLGDAPKVPFTVDRFFSWRKYLDYAGGPCTDLFPHVFTPFVSAIGLKFPTRAVASGGIFKYTTYDREVPDTFNMCLDYPEKLSIVLPCTLANDYPPEAAIRGDEGTLTLQNPGRMECRVRQHHHRAAEGRVTRLPGREAGPNTQALAELPELRAEPGETGERRGVWPSRDGRPEHGDAEFAQGEGGQVRFPEAANCALAGSGVVAGPGGWS